MTLNLYAFTCGTVTGEFVHLMEVERATSRCRSRSLSSSTPRDGHYSTRGCTSIASTIPLNDLVSGSLGFSVSGFSRAKK
jgi:hypothetical protein